MGVALLLGIVLAIDATRYQLWDAWIIIAIVLWALGLAAGAAHRRVLHGARAASRGRGAEPRARCSPGCAPRPASAGSSGDRRRLRAARPRHDLQAVGVVTSLAAIRPDDGVNVALLVHVIGAMVLVGSARDGGHGAAARWRRRAAVLSRLGYFTLLAVGCRAGSLMRHRRRWIYSKETGTRSRSEPGLARASATSSPTSRRAPAARRADPRRHRRVPPMRAPAESRISRCRRVVGVASPPRCSPRSTSSPSGAYRPRGSRSRSTPAPRRRRSGGPTRAPAIPPVEEPRWPSDEVVSGGGSPCPAQRSPLSRRRLLTDASL